MPLLPALKAMFEAQRSPAPLPPDMPPAQRREAMHAMMEQGYFAFATQREPVAVERDIAIPVAGGEIPLRLYLPDTENGPWPCHIYYHGGGFFLGTLDHSDNNCRALATDAACAVVSVDYRLAPEHPFPIAAEDAYAALCWVSSHAAELGVDPARLSVGGGSAGGNLAAVVALMARDRRGPRIVGQVLEIPVTDFTSTSVLDFPDESIHLGSVKGYGPLYLGDPEDAQNPLASPLLAPTLEDLPSALVMCAEYDQLQPEGEAYARRLDEAGVSVAYHCWPGQFHGSQGFDKIIPEEAAAYHAEVVSFLRRAHQRPHDSA